MRRTGKTAQLYTVVHLPNGNGVMILRSTLAALTAWVREGTRPAPATVAALVKRHMATASGPTELGRSILKEPATTRGVADGLEATGFASTGVRAVLNRAGSSGAPLSRGGTLRRKVRKR